MAMQDLPCGTVLNLVRPAGAVPGVGAVLGVIEGSIGLDGSVIAILFSHRL
jgi:hypothetical protein